MRVGAPLYLPVRKSSRERKLIERTEELVKRSKKIGLYGIRRDSSSIETWKGIRGRRSGMRPHFHM